MASAWEESCAKVRAERDASIPKEWLLKELPGPEVTDVMSVPYTCGIMTEKELALTELDATELLAMMATGKAKSYDVTLAFCKRAAIAQQLLNCLTVLFAEEALERARELDDIFEKTGKPVGPYHGLPFSIKDLWSIKGKEANCAYVGMIGNKPKEDAMVVAILRQAGCVFYCKTTQPQSAMQLETTSNVYGTTSNPFNRNLTCGGSSGGEGALVGFRGSPIGMASDIGGSIRSPAANNGLFGAKITSLRVPRDGISSPGGGNDAVPVSGGPVCRSARDNEHFFRVILGAEPWKMTQTVIPLPWREDVVLPKKMTIGFLWDDGVVKPHPPLTAAMKNLAAKMQALPDQFDVVDFAPMDHALGYDIVRRLYFIEGGKMHTDMMAKTGEPAMPLTEWVLKSPPVEDLTTTELCRLQVKRDQYRAQYLKHWIESGVDFVVSPVGPGVAPLHGTSKYWGYTAVWNILDWPASVFPTGEFVDPAVHVKDTAYAPRDNEFDAYNWGTYEPEKFAGAPIAFQLISRRYDDEKVVKAVEKLADVLGLKDGGSYKNKK